ncbi:MAG: hypothetical protein ACI3ZO_01020 [Candidatus Cryptobacteroides sp.]
MNAGQSFINRLAGISTGSAVPVPASVSGIQDDISQKKGITILLVIKNVLAIFVLALKQKRRGLAVPP